MITHTKNEIKGTEYYTYFDSTENIIRLATKWSKHLASLCGVSYSPDTVSTYSKRIKKLLGWIETSQYFQNLTIDEVLATLDREFIEDWVISEKVPNYVQSTVKEFLSWLQTDRAGRARDEQNNPFRSGKLISRGRNQNSVPKSIGADEFIVLINELYHESEKVFFHMLFDVGLRISEGLALTKGDLPDTRFFPNANYYPIIVPGAKGKAGAKKYRLSFISRAVLERIQEYHQNPIYRLAKGWAESDPKKPMFLSTRREKLTDAIAQQLKAAAKRGKAKGTLDKNKSYHCHMLRAGSALSYLLSELGKDYPDKLLMIKSILGHVHQSTTEIYAHIPLALLNRKEVYFKYEEAELIYNETKKF